MSIHLLTKPRRPPRIAGAGARRGRPRSIARGAFAVKRRPYSDAPPPVENCCLWCGNNIPPVAYRECDERCLDRKIKMPGSPMPPSLTHEHRHRYCTWCLGTYLEYWPIA